MFRCPMPDAGHSYSRERVAVFMISYDILACVKPHADRSYDRPRGSEDENFSQMPRGKQSAMWQGVLSS